MKLYRIAALALPLAFCSTGFAPSLHAQETQTAQPAVSSQKTQDQLKSDEKANKEQAKADKQQRKALKQQDKAAKAQKKAEEKSAKTGATSTAPATTTTTPPQQ